MSIPVGRKSISLGIVGVWSLYLSANARIGAENKTEEVDDILVTLVNGAVVSLSCADDCCDGAASIDCCVF